MSITSWLGDYFDPTGAQAVANSKGILDNTLGAGSDYYKSGNLGLGTQGTAGNALLTSLANAQANNVGANFTPMDRDTAALSGLGSTFADQFAHGGKAEAAARNRAVSSMADAGGGGLAGVKALQTASQNISQQAEQTSLQERGQAATLENQSNLEAGMIGVRKLALQAAITHANMQKNNAAQHLTNSLINQQTANAQALRSGAVQAQHAGNELALGQQQANNNLALGLINTGANIVGQAGSTAYSAFGANDTSITQPSEDEINAAKESTLDDYGVASQHIGVPTPAVTGQAAALTTQNALNQALGTTSSKITFPSLQSDVSSYLTDPSSYPLTSSLR